MKSNKCIHCNGVKLVSCTQRYAKVVTIPAEEFVERSHTKHPPKAKDVWCSNCGIRYIADSLSYVGHQVKVI